jgi:DNA-binding transcriptional MerR regulator
MMQTNAADDLLLTNEVARLLDVSPQTVRLWERTGRLAATKTTKGVRLFKRGNVEDLARERRRFVDHRV